MKRITVYLVLGMSFILFGSMAVAKTKSKTKAKTAAVKVAKKRVSANVEPLKTKGKWVRDKFSTLNTKGLSIADEGTCERFEIEVLDKNLVYKIRCGRHFSSGLIPLQNEKDYKVEKKESEITITKLSHYGQKVQISQMGQSLVRIPFVEEVTFIKFLTDGTLTFYKENFSVDDFGRVVQKSFLQGYGLSSKTMSVSRR